MPCRSAHYRVSKRPTADLRAYKDHKPIKTKDSPSPSTSPAVALPLTDSKTLQSDAVSSSSDSSEKAAVLTRIENLEKGSVPDLLNEIHKLTQQNKTLTSSLTEANEDNLEALQQLSEARQRAKSIEAKNARLSEAQSAVSTIVNNHKVVQRRYMIHRDRRERLWRESVRRYQRMLTTAQARLRRAAERAEED